MSMQFSAKARAPGAGRTGARRIAVTPFVNGGACRAPRGRCVRVASQHPEAASSGDVSDGGLAAAFSALISAKGIPSPATVAQRAHPSPLLPPHSVVQQAMDVLQRNDWPEPDSGVMSAFNLTQHASEGPDAGSVRSWRAAEEWLPWDRFHAQIHTAYTPLLNCDSWKVLQQCRCITSQPVQRAGDPRLPVASPLVFPSSRFDNKAVQAVEVMARPRPVARPGSPIPAAVPDTALRPYSFTFCLERATDGAYKDCWLISGVRIGNYAL